MFKIVSRCNSFRVPECSGHNRALNAEIHFFDTPSLLRPKFQGVPFGVDPRSTMSGFVGYLTVKLFYTCDHIPPMSQTTDSQTNCYGKTALQHCLVKTILINQSICRDLIRHSLLTTVQPQQAFFFV